MTDPRQHGMQLAEYVRELTSTHTHNEPYVTRTGSEWVTRTHRTRVPSLLAQLWANDTPGTAEQGAGARPGFESKPAARLDALDAAVRIDIEASRWVTDLGETTTGHTDTTAIIRQLHSLTATAEPVQRSAINRDVRRWWIQARIVTGWDSPAWTPDNTCPQCGDRGTLRVRLADRVAMCTTEACAATWDPATIGLLADHIRAENDSERKTRPGAGPCWCPYPAPSVPDLEFMCAACGSVRCRHALGARLVDELRAQASA